MGGTILKKITVSLIILIILLNWNVPAESKDVVVYSARNEHLIRPLFEEYTGKTGVKISYITGKAPVLLQRLKAEGQNTPADMLLTVDAGNLWHAAREGVLQPVESKVLQQNIPAHLRDPNNLWFGLSVRARTIVYSTERVSRQELDTYEALAESRWKGRLLLRTSKKVYNQSLVAMLISQYGTARTEEIVQGWVANLAAAPFSNDTKVMQAIMAGQGDVGIVNTYYFGRLQKENSEIPLALFWPNQQSSGVHVNVSGAGITAHAPHRREAIALLGWLSSEKAQHLFADANLEYPANPAVLPAPAVKAWGSFKENAINLENAGAYQVEAIRLMDRAGYK